MKLEYVITNNKDKKICSTIEDGNEYILDYIHSENEIIEINSKKFRVGFRRTLEGSVYGFSSHKNYLKSSRLFNNEMDLLISSLEKIKEAVKEAEKFAFKQVNILIHNLTTINAHSIQDIFNFVPAESLKGTVKEINRSIKNRIKGDVDKATELFFKILKNNSEMKAEFSVFNKLHEDNPILNFKEFKIDYSIVNVLYNFFPDFTDKNIEVQVNGEDYYAYFDYESIHVALFHMIDNITKYIKKDSTLNISFELLIDEIVIKFNMISLRILPQEIHSIFEDGYSGSLAKEFKKNGKGIGMSRVKKLLELNNGYIKVEELNRYDEKYSTNEFCIYLKRTSNDTR
ncbi:hypothetical protein ACOTVJ_10695 [Aliarcobacter butzleri]